MIAFRVSGLGNVELQLASAQLRVREALRKSVIRNATELLAYVKAEKLSGQVLKNRTGRLRRSQSRQTVETRTRIAAQVGTNLEYAAAHEYGVEKTVKVRLHEVKQHWRHNVTRMFGKEVAPRSVLVPRHAVRAHPMRMKLPERSFLRSALADRSAAIVANLQADVVAAAEGRS